MPTNEKQFEQRGGGGVQRMFAFNEFQCSRVSTIYCSRVGNTLHVQTYIGTL